jgi:hypothetical protein
MVLHGHHRGMEKGMAVARRISMNEIERRKGKVVCVTSVLGRERSYVVTTVTVSNKQEVGDGVLIHRIQAGLIRIRFVMKRSRG